MKERRLLYAIGWVKDEYIEEMQEAKSPRINKKRIWLIAAVIAAMLILAGCVAVFLGLQRRKIGEIPVTQKFDTFGKPLAEPEKTWYIASMSGFDNSAAQQASKEWNEFQASYEPAVRTDESDLPNIPNQYEYTYQCWDQTMVDKLNEIAEKYGLELLGTRGVAQSWQRNAAFDALGITQLIREEAPVDFGYGACRVYPPYNFVCDVYLTLTGDNSPWTQEVHCKVYYLQSGYLAPDDTFMYDPQTTQEWEYITAGGTKVLLALSGTKGIVLAQREDSTIVIRMDLAWQQGVFLNDGTELPTMKAMEHLADCFDYNVKTKAAPMEGLQEQFNAIPNPNNPPSEGDETPQYGSYADFLNQNYLWPEFVEYAFYDIDGDGQQDLITSYGDGFCINWLSIRDGRVIDLLDGMGAMRLCEGGIVESRDPSLERHMYFKILDSDPIVGTEEGHLHTVCFSNGEWTIDDKPCTEQEATDLMNQYQPMQLTWKPLLDFPMNDNGTTFADILAAEEDLSGDALLDFYGKNCPKEFWGGEFAWFELRDINSDGTEDLLLSIDGEYINLAYTYKRGKLIDLGASFYLCQNNILHFVDEVDRYNEGVLERHRFSKLTGKDVTFHYRLSHNLSTGIWIDTNYTEISADEAQTILSEYSHVEMNMRPISELFGG